MNIAEILKNYPEGTKLYSLVYGDCEYLRQELNNKIKINVKKYYIIASLTPEGKVHESGEMVLFPSKTMRDWVPLMWQKGVVLKSGCQYVTFDHFNENFTTFVGSKLYDSKTGFEMLTSTLLTKDWELCTDCTPYLHYLEKDRFKPFDKVLIRHSVTDEWIPAIYSHYANNMHVMIDGLQTVYCVPYYGNEDAVLTKKHIL